MNYKRLMATVLIVAMLGMILPMFPVSADIECMSYPIFEVLVEGETSWIDFVPDENPIYLEEMTYGKGSTFEVEVWVRGVEDMFAYEFTLTWEKNYWLISAYTVEDVWPSQHKVKPDLNYDLYKLGYKTTTYYEQVVSALPPSTGVSGDIKLATLTFKIHTDIAYHEDDFETTFEVTGKLSDSCSQKIDYCDPHYALVYFCSAKPGIEMRPNNETNSAWGIHEKFTKEIWITDVTKVKSIHFDLRWNKWFGADMVDLHVWEFDKVTLAHADVLKLTEDTYTDEDGITVDIQIKCTATELRGEELRILTLTFVKLDPWPCGQPKYTYKQPHEWTPENATCMFYFYKGYFDVLCPDLAYIYFGKIMKSPLGTLVDSETLFDGKGLPENYGTAEWVDAISGGGSVNLTTYVPGDAAFVLWQPKAPISLQDINKIFFKYYHNWPVTKRPGPRMMLGVNGSGSNNYILMSESAPCVWSNEWEATVAASWWGMWIGWDNNFTKLTLGDFSGWGATWPLNAGPTANYGDWAALKTAFGLPAGDPTANVTWIGLFMYYALPGFDAPGAEKGSAVVDFMNIEIDDPRGPAFDFNMTYDLEPPGGRASWYDPGFYVTLQEKIVNLYTFVPIPGDLNRDGVVDITDVLIIAQAYGAASTSPYNLDKKDDVDIFDIVIVCKQFGRTSP